MTLIELMIAVGIVGILAAVAYPAYSNYVERSRRADGQVALIDAAQRLERCYVQNNTYAGCIIPATSPEGFYALAAPTQTAAAFSLTATPQGVQAADAKCGTLSLGSTGERDATGSLGAGACW